MTSSNQKPAKAPRRRARKSDGTFKGDIPGTKANEAWESEDISTEVGEKSVDYTVRKKVDASGDAGKYGMKPPVRPRHGIGNVRTTYH